MKNIFLLVIIVALAACAGGGNKNEKISLSKKMQVEGYDSTELATIEVSSLTLRYFPEDEEKVLRNPKETHKQFIRIETKVTGNGDIPFNFTPTGFYVQGAKGEKDFTTILLNESNVTDLYKDNKELKKGESVTGAIYFEVDSAETAKTLTLYYPSYDKDGNPSAVGVKLE